MEGRSHKCGRKRVIMKLEIVPRYTFTNIDPIANPIFAGMYEEVLELPNQFYALFRNNLCKICTPSGTLLYVTASTGLRDSVLCREPNFTFVKNESKWRLLLKDGTVSSLEFDEVDCRIGNDLLIGVRSGEHWGYIDCNGIIRVPCIYDHLYYFAHNNFLPIPVKLGNDFTFYDFTSKERFELFQPDLGKFVATVTRSGKYNLLFPNGELLFDNFVDKFNIITRQGIIVNRGSMSDWYTLEGKKILSDYLAIIPQKNMMFFIVKTQTGYGVADSQGILLTKCIYESKMLLTEKMFILKKDGEFVLFKRDRGEIFTPRTSCETNSIQDFLLSALNYYLS